MINGLLPHTPYSPDLAPLDLHLFGPIKEALREKTFEGNENVKAAAHVWFINQR